MLDWFLGVAFLLLASFSVSIFENPAMAIYLFGIAMGFFMQSAAKSIIDALKDNQTQKEQGDRKAQDE